MTHFLFDCDDVLLDWHSGFIEFLRGEGYLPCPAGPQDWDLAHWIGCSSEDARRAVLRFNASPAFGRLDAMPGAINTIFELRSQGHTIDVITSCGATHALRMARMDNLNAVFQNPMVRGKPPFGKLHILDIGVSKFETLMRYDPSCVFVEDNFSHARSGAIRGMKSYCIRRSHNRRHEAENPETAVTWIDDISDVLRDFPCIPVQQ